MTDPFTAYNFEINLCFALLEIREYNMPYIPRVGPIIKCFAYTKHSEPFNERLQKLPLLPFIPSGNHQECAQQSGAYLEGSFPAKSSLQ